MTQRARVVVIALVVAVVMVGFGALSAVGSRRADAAIASVRARAAVSTVSASDVVGDAFAGEGAVARKLGVSPSEVSMSSSGSSSSHPDEWCIEVSVRRLTVSRSASFLARPGESMTAVADC